MFGPVEVAMEKLAAFGDACMRQGVHLAVVDEIEQLQRYSEEVIAQLDA